MSERGWHPSAELIQEVCESLHAELATLSTRESFVLTHRFALNGQRFETLAAIGQHLSLSAERVRQIEARALEKLRRRVRDKRLGRV